jgi:hypothetical protein
MHYPDSLISCDAGSSARAETRSQPSGDGGTVELAQATARVFRPGAASLVFWRCRQQRLPQIFFAVLHCHKNDLHSSFKIGCLAGCGKLEILFGTLKSLSQF